MFDFFPGLSADTYVTTPGETAVLGGGLPADGDDTFGDVSDDGPQTDFQFAQMTFPSGGGVSFSGEIAIAGSDGVFSQAFDFLDFPITQQAFLDSYPADGSVVSIDLAAASSDGRVSDAIVISAAGPNGLPFEIFDVTVSNDAAALFDAAANGGNIDVMLDLDAARQLPGRTLATADLMVTTNSGNLGFRLTALVPEPAAMLLAMVSATSACCIRRR